MQQAEDFRDEVQAVAHLLHHLDDEGFKRITQFKGWSFNDVVGHLYMFDHAARLSLQDRAAFDDFWQPFAKGLAQGKSFLQMQGPWLDGLEGGELYQRWLESANATADAYAKADPKERIAWAGPDMSVRSSITARQMELWAHSQALYDALGVVRLEQDRIRNIVYLGVLTYEWSFKVNGLSAPEPAPYLRLEAPSGEIWEYNTPQGDNVIQGAAFEFAQVVCQTRNVADTALDVRGQTAAHWMAIAQCFAGRAEAPPAKGRRFLQKAVDA